MKLSICTYKIESTNIQIITNYSSTTRKAQVVLDSNSIPLQIQDPHKIWHHTVYSGYFFLTWEHVC
jgi:hypothetical protein